jgi:hypothetical protein
MSHMLYNLANLLVMLKAQDNTKHNSLACVFFLSLLVHCLFTHTQSAHVYQCTTHSCIVWWNWNGIMHGRWVHVAADVLSFGSVDVPLLFGSAWTHLRKVERKSTIGGRQRQGTMIEHALRVVNYYQIYLVTFTLNHLTTRSALRAKDEFINLVY